MAVNVLSTTIAAAAAAATFRRYLDDILMKILTKHSNPITDLNRP